MHLRENLYSRCARQEPEEATSLGVAGLEYELRDMSDEGEDARRDLWRDALAFAEVETEDETPDRRIERLTLRRHARLELALAEEGSSRSNPQWATYPYTMSRYLAAHRRATPAELAAEDGPYRARARALPRFLARHRGALQWANQERPVAHRAFLECLRDHELPAARDWFAVIDAEAARACEAQIAFIETVLLPGAPETMILGAERYARRLALTHGIERPLDDLVAEARDALEITQAEMIAVAAEIAGAATIRRFPDVVALMGEMQQETLDPGVDLSAHYRALMRRAMDALVDRGEFAPLDLAEVGMDDYPEGMREMGAGTNWPAPLLDASAQGQFVLHPDPKAHSRAWSGVLAVHEGCPGHFLQSRAFRRRFGRSRAPLRFIAVADDVAIPRLNFGSMLAIEGWAVYAESLVRRSGVLEGTDLLFALAADALRAVRVIGEIELHRRTLSPAEVDHFVRRNAGLRSAFWELERYQRGPTQAVAYFFGAREIERLRGEVEARRGPEFDPARFHEDLLACGPVLPRDARPILLGDAP